MQGQDTIQRIAWGLSDIAESTGLSLAFLRNEVRRKVLPVKRFGRRVLVLDDDLKSYLSKGRPNSEGECSQAEMSSSTIPGA